MKKLLIFFLILLSFNQFSFAAFDNISNLQEVDLGSFSKPNGNELTGSTNNSSTGQSSKISKEVIVSSQISNVTSSNPDIIQAFCDLHKLSANNPITYVSKFENTKIMQTYLNVFGQEILSESKMDAESIAKGFNISGKGNPKEYQQKAEIQCLQFRGEKPENNEKINNLYEQVKFYNEYYSSYHDELTKGIVPSFLIMSIDGINTLVIYIMLFTILNIIVRTIIVVLGKEFVKNRTALMNSIWYFMIVISIKLGIVGSLILLIGFQGLDIIKTLFWF